MSIIGTRPPLISETNLYELHHRARLAIKPGITGMWQVSGRSDITDFEEVVRLDKEYITNWNIGLDCPHKVQAGRYSHCPEDAYPVSVIEGHIWYSLKRILRILDSVQRESEEKYTDNSFTGKRQQKVLESELEKLKNERIHQYEAYAEGVLSREKYITVKKQLTEKIEKISTLWIIPVK